MRYTERFDEKEDIDVCSEEAGGVDGLEGTERERSFGDDDQMTAGDSTRLAHLDFHPDFLHGVTL